MAFDSMNDAQGAYQRPSRAKPVPPPPAYLMPEEIDRYNNMLPDTREKFLKLDTRAFEILWDRGVNSKKIAKAIGVGNWTVINFAAMLGLPSRTIVMPNFDTDLLLEMWAWGVSRKDIAAYFNCKRVETVGDKLKALGAERRHQRDKLKYAGKTLEGFFEWKKGLSHEKK